MSPIGTYNKKVLKCIRKLNRNCLFVNKEKPNIPNMIWNLKPLCMIEMIK